MAFLPGDPKEAVEAALKMLQSMSQDREIPRNIREVILKSIEYLQREDRNLHMRASAAADALNEISEKQNVPMHIRQRIRQILVLLESVPPE